MNSSPSKSVVVLSAAAMELDGSNTEPLTAPTAATDTPSGTAREEAPKPEPLRATDASASASASAAASYHPTPPMPVAQPRTMADDEFAFDADGPPCCMDNTLCCPCGVRNGHTLTLYRCGPTARTWPFACVLGPHYGCSPCTLACMILPTVMFLVLAAPEIHPAVWMGGTVLLCATVIMYLVTAFSDPGYIKKRPPMSPDDLEAAVQADRERLHAAGELENHTYCTKCMKHRPAFSHHCRDCGVCVEKLDHHCPWTGKCIGKSNLRPFFIWLGLLQFLSCFVVVGLIAYGIVRAS